MTDNRTAMELHVLRRENAELREEVVRCKDCENYATDELGGYCTLLDFEDANGMEDKFCAWACRKEQ